MLVLNADKAINKVGINELGNLEHFWVNKSLKQLPSVMSF